MATLTDRITDLFKLDFLKPTKPKRGGGADAAPADAVSNGDGAAAAPKKRAAAKKRAARGKARTREQLYKEATRLKVAGRSKMNKAQLERAIAKQK